MSDYVQDRIEGSVRIPAWFNIFGRLWLRVRDRVRYRLWFRVRGLS